MAEALRDPQAGSREGWWLRLAAPSGAGHYDLAIHRRRREHLRHAKLTAYLAPFIFFAPLLFWQQAASDLGTAVGMVIIMSMSLLAIFLNRTGNQVFAALLLVLSLDAILEGALVTAPGGLGSGWLLTFDLFVFPLCVVGVLLQRQYIWIFALLHICMILGDFFLLHHTQDLVTLISQWGPTVAFVRPVLLQVGCGLVCWLAISSTDEAIRRADQAEMVAQLQEAIAEEKRQLEEGIQQLVVVLTNGANGHYAVTVQLPQDSALWRIGSALNTLFARLQHSRQTEQKTQQLLREIQTVTALIQAARLGRTVQWPTTSNSHIEPLIRELKTIFPATQLPQTRQLPPH